MTWWINWYICKKKKKKRLTGNFAVQIQALITSWPPQISNPPSATGARVRFPVESISSLWFSPEYIYSIRNLLIVYMHLNTMNCDIGEVTERLENELFPSLHLRHSSLFNLSVGLPTSQLILQLFRRFTYVTVLSPTLPLVHLRHSSFYNPSLASPTLQALHLHHLASRPCTLLIVDI